MSVSGKVENNTDNMAMATNMENKVARKEDDFEVCVCRVPKSLRSGHPEAFTPHFVGLGPYHHTRFELTMTDELKLAAARRILNHAFEIHVSDVRPFYHQEAFTSYGYKDDEILRDITIAGLFLLALLYRSLDAQPHQHTYFLTGKHGMPLVNTFGVELTIHAIIRDVFMVENQIPTHLLHQINQARTHLEIQSHDLGAKMQSFCQNYCPLVNFEKPSKNTEEHAHLLDLMYHMVAPKPDPNSAPKPKPKPKAEPDPKPDTVTNENPESSAVTTEKPKSTAVTTEKPESVLVTIEMPESPDKPAGYTENGENPEKSGSKTKPSRCFSIVSSISFYIFLFSVIIGVILWYFLCFIWKITFGVLRILYGILKRVSSVFVKLSTLFLPLVDDTIEVLPSSQREKLTPVINKAKKTGETIRRHFFGEKDTRPAVTIQSVTELDGAGIHFKPAKGGIKDLKFDEGTKQLFLPVIQLDENSEVIMRNLVAYESLTRPTYLIFTRYVEIMRAIIDTPKDVNLLVNKQIIVTELSDKVVADLFNGMSVSIRPTNTPELEEVIKKVKTKFEESQWLKKVAVEYAYSSWKILTVIAALSFFVLTAVQTYCSIYDCASRSSSTFGTLPAVSDNGLISSM
ncbi:hypothetical protein VNO80_16106 [Phaseolus coccineus]|uniref:Uncharacterized protein n=1 Tax=Phaseolus coccineus TaxID=3886 RepID=A0AAN9MRG8_PHACN